MGPKGKAFGRRFASLGNIKKSVPARCARPRWRCNRAAMRARSSTEAASGTRRSAARASCRWGPEARDARKRSGLARLNNGAIAGQLQKSNETVRNQMSSIFNESGVRTRAEAIVHVRDRDPRP
jgi:hypothetical protein